MIGSIAFASGKACRGDGSEGGARRRENAYTLAEVMIGLSGSILIIGALLFGSIGLQKSLHSSELYAAYQADQRRVLDYLSRDLRRSIGIGSSTTISGSATQKTVAGTIMVENQTALVLTLPGYYKGNEPGANDYDQPLPVIAGDDRVDYGSTAGLAAGVKVIFRREYIARERCVCIVRQEEDATLIIVRHAENLHLQVTVTPDGSSCLVQVAFLSPYGDLAPLVATHDNVLLRNIRTD